MVTLKMDAAGITSTPGREPRGTVTSIMGAAIVVSDGSNLNLWPAIETHRPAGDDGW